MSKHTEQTLPDDPEALKALVHSLQEQVTSQHAQIAHLQEQVRLFTTRQFGRRSEKVPGQAELFDEAEVAAEAEPDAPDEAEAAESTASTPAAPRPKPGRKPLPAYLPRVRVEHDLPEADKTCGCGCRKVCIGEQTSEQLDIIPAVVQVIVHARKQYACKACESAPVIADKPPQPIPKSNAAPGLLAHIAVAKYQDGLPLYRMATIFQRLGIHLPRNTQANWLIRCGELLQPLYNLLQDTLLDSGYLHMDETTVQVLKEPDKPPESRSYMWVRKTGDPDRPVVLFDYAASRSGKTAATLLAGYQGYLQTDDYAGYHACGRQAGIVHLGCWAHARRKFVDAQKATPSPKGKVSKAAMAINTIGKLYAIEKRIQGLPAADKYQQRQADSVPLLDELRQWLDKALQHTLPKGKAGEALRYLDNNWAKLCLYTTDGRLNIDNNPVENAIRPFAIGRKNWLFADSQAGARTSAMLYSLIETAKANRLEPYAYLKALFTQLPMAETVDNIEQLLPWRIVLDEANER